MSKAKLTLKTDKLLGFRLVADKQANALGAKVGGKLGLKPMTIGVKAGMKVL